MKEQWKHEMQEKMADYKKSAPELSWSEIETAVRKSRQAKVVVMWRRRIAVAAAVVLLVGGLGFFAFRQPHKELASHYSKESGMTGNKQQSESVINIIKSTVSPFVRHSATNIVAALKESTDEKTQAIKDDSVKTIAMSKEERTDTEQKMQKPNDRRSYQPYNPVRYSRNNSSSVSGNKLTAKVYISNTIGSNSTGSYGPVLEAAFPFDENNPSVIGGGDTQIQNHGEEVNSSVHHHQPIRFGVSVRYSLNNRWSIETGLTYSYLSSDINRTSGNCTYNTAQKLSYVGVPVNLNYSLWSGRRFNIYVSGGFTTEKMVKGKANTKIIGDGKTESVTDNDIKISPLQFSVNGGVGAECKIDRTFSIYAEPKVGYYFDNGSNVATLYKDKPLNIDINVGLRLNIK